MPERWRVMSVTLFSAKAPYEGTWRAYINRSQVWTAVGMWAWLLHRITGLALVFYILLHVVLMGTFLLQGRSAFDALLGLLMGNPFFQGLDLLLTAAVLYHGANGIRLLLFDLGLGFNRQKEIFWTFMILAALVYAAVLWVMVPEILGRWR